MITGNVLDNERGTRHTLTGFNKSKADVNPGLPEFDSSPPLSFPAAAIGPQTYWPTGKGTWLLEAPHAISCDHPKKRICSGLLVWVWLWGKKNSSIATKVFQCAPLTSTAFTVPVASCYYYACYIQVHHKYSKCSVKSILLHLTNIYRRKMCLLNFWEDLVIWFNEPISV